MTGSDWQVGNLRCEENCVVPEGLTMVETPPSRHAWSDIVRCPNEGCGKTFLVRKLEAK